MSEIKEEVEESEEDLNFDAGTIQDIADPEDKEIIDEAEEEDTASTEDDYQYAELSGTDTVRDYLKMIGSILFAECRAGTGTCRQGSRRGSECDGSVW
jgi:hypothetical protein